ncbi:hypothetical protein C8F01DRAFT_1110109 [Mycena amicta]|nr:hypothetical protein C8F01DRAFT_1110109 [Mycena amicta]
MSGLLPQELLDLFVQHLPDIESIKACSLAGREFLHSTRAQVFRKLRIVPPADSVSDRPQERGPIAAELQELLHSSPYIARRIEQLEIVLVGTETSFEYDEDGDYLEERREPWIMQDRVLAKILPRLSLKHIALVENAPAEWNGGGDFSMSWNRLDAALQTALTDVFASKRLQSVHIRGLVLESPLQILYLFSQTTSLVELSLARIHYTQRWDLRETWPATESWAPKLQKLLVSDTFGDLTCRYLLSPQIDLGSVNSFALATDLREWRIKFLDTVTTSTVLEHLRLSLLREDGFLIANLLNNRLPSTLRSIHLFHYSVLHLLAYIDLAYKDFPSTIGRLESITVEGPAPRSLDAWETAVSAMSLQDDVGQSQRFSSLQRFEIRAYVSPDSELTFAEWAEIMRRSLRALQRPRLLYVVRSCGIDEEPHRDWE